MHIAQFTNHDETEHAKAFKIAHCYPTSLHRYNVSHVGVSLGDVRFAVQCLKLALTCNPRHAEAYNNLGALEHRQGNAAQARAHYTTATEHGEQLYEPRYNMALLCEGECMVRSLSFWRVNASRCYTRSRSP